MQYQLSLLSSNQTSFWISNHLIVWFIRERSRCICIVLFVPPVCCKYSRDEDEDDHEPLMTMNSGDDDNLDDSGGGYEFRLRVAWLR